MTAAESALCAIDAVAQWWEAPAILRDYLTTNDEALRLAAYTAADADVFTKALEQRASAYDHDRSAVAFAASAARAACEHDRAAVEIFVKATFEALDRGKERV